MNQKPQVLAFFLLTMVFSWACWIPFAAARAGLLSVPIPAEVVWLGEFGPSLIALGLTGFLGGPQALQGLLRKLVTWRVPARCYLFALGLTPVLVLVSLGIDGLLFGTTYDPHQLAGWDQRFVERTSAFEPSLGLISGLVYFMRESPWATGLCLVLLAVTNGGLSEEVGWRGYALPSLHERGHSPLRASLLVGGMWAVWHTAAPVWQVLLTAPLGEGLGFAALVVLQYLLLLLPLSVLYTVLMRGTGGSVLLAVLLHASYNLTITLVASAWPEFPMVTLLVLLWLLALVLTVRLRLWRAEASLTASDGHLNTPIV